MKPLRHALVTLALLSGCAASQPEVRAVDPTPVPASTHDAGAPPDAPTEAAAAPTAVTAEQLQACDDACLTAETDALLAAVRRVESEPGPALPALRALRSPEAHLWALYAAAQAHDEAALQAERALLTAAQLLETDTPQTADPALTNTLTSLRVRLDGRGELNDQGRAGLVPCWLFARHGRVALEAFAPRNGSTLDARGAADKDRCLEARLAPMPAAERAAFTSARQSLETAMLRVAPRPEEGTIWTANWLSATGHLTDAALDPRAAQEHGSDAELDQTVARMPRRMGRLGSRVAAYRRARDAALPALSAGVCASARAVSVTVDAAACTERARAGANAMLRSWLSAVGEDH